MAVLRDRLLLRPFHALCDGRGINPLILWWRAKQYHAELCDACNSSHGCGGG